MDLLACSVGLFFLLSNENVNSWFTTGMSVNLKYCPNSCWNKYLNNVVISKEQSYVLVYTLYPLISNLNVYVAKAGRIDHI